MAHRIETGLSRVHPDPRGEKMRRAAAHAAPAPVEGIRTVDVYTLDAALDEQLLARIAREVFADPVTHDWAVDAPIEGEYDWIAEVGMRPGVTDTVGRTASEALALFLGGARPAIPVAFAVQYRLRAPGLRREDVERVAAACFSNPLVQRCAVWSRDEVRAMGRLPAHFPRVAGDARGEEVESFDLAGMGDEELAALSRARVLSLSAAEMRAIAAHVAGDRERGERRAAGLPAGPTDVELECIAQTWSEHCKHKIFNARIRYADAREGTVETIDGLFGSTIVAATDAVRRLLGAADYCLSVFTDNAGVVRFDDDHVVAIKVETHNAPSALDPYGGALTGIVGVNRDLLGTGMGTMPLFNTNVFCLGFPDRAGELPPRVRHPARTLEGVREGVEHGGNKSGIPTVNGSVFFDERFTARPLVFCGTGGIAPARVAGGAASHRKGARPGDRVVMTGGAIGKDGIHGATFSSDGLHEGSPASAVQIGDPITQKRMSDFLLAARDEGLYRSVTDNGAGGLSSSVGEMAREAGGASVELSGAPLKYAGLRPWEIFLSEAQERMTFAVPPETLDRFLALAARMSVTAVDLGRFDGSGTLHVTAGGRTVARLPLDFLHDGLPRLELDARWDPPPRGPLRAAPGTAAPRPEELPELLARPGVASKEYWVRQYDHEVQGGSVVKPLCGPRGDGPSDGAVIMPVLGRTRGLAVAHGLCPRAGDVDGRAMARCALDEAVRGAVAVGADPAQLAALDNFCWPDPVPSPQNPDGERLLGQLVRACRGLMEACVDYRVPLVSGKDSMKNEYRHEGTRIAIPPTLLVTAIGIVPDVRRAVTADAKAPGDLVYVAGTTRAALAATEWAAMRGAAGGDLPDVRTEESGPLYARLHRAMREGLVRSCHDCAEGGLGVALAETAIAGRLGMRVDLGGVPADGALDGGTLLFSESPGRFVVTVAPRDAARFEEAMRGSPLGAVGRVSFGADLVVDGARGEGSWRWDVHALAAAWKGALAL